MGETNGTGPQALEGSREAKRLATAILETLGGVRSAPEASEALGIALARYYVLETRALQGMIAALEPRSPGRVRTAEAEIEHLKGEVSRLERELLRYQALHRISQRAIGLPREEPAKGRGAKSKSVRTRRKRTRGDRIVDGLREEKGESSPTAVAGSEPTSSKEV